MKIKVLKFFALLFLLFAFDTKANGEFRFEVQPEGIYIDNVNVAVLKKIFADYNYTEFVQESKKIPPLMLQSMPFDFNDIKSKDERNKLFIQIMTPLVMKVNEDITIERKKLFDLKSANTKKEGLSEQQKKEIEDLAVKYDVFTKMKGKERYDIILEELTEKIDIIPASLLIAVAVAESNWGTAREVKEGNALFKEKEWFTDKGIKPAKEDDDSYRIKVYPNLLSAIEDYALKLNKDINFSYFRVSRKFLRIHNQVLKGRVTVHNMVTGSPLENYAGLLNYILTFYDLVNIDESQLDSISSLEK
ncbi:MAG: glucosaminidase domain-containing protein [Alphaproteobacteria bacterium]|nr:glucosaminidase domain-containing protein [Alphaproteobacteria bacterium]